MTSRTGTKSASIPSTEAQNSLGEVLGRVARGEHIFITRYGRREAVLLSAEEYDDLVGDEPVDLTALHADFDRMMERMQTPEHRAATDALFGMSGEAVGEAAVQPARPGEGEEPGPVGA